MIIKLFTFSQQTLISAVVKCATRKNWEVYGIPSATEGFMQLARGENKPEDFRLKDHGYEIPGFLKGLDVFQFLSGSILGSLSSGRPVIEDIIKGYQILGLNALIAVGGDGSLDIIYHIAKQGNWNLIAIPKTIDNDVPYTEQSVGFDTAVNTVTKAIYDLTFTAASHERVMIVEVMGRDAGHLALHSGIAGGADIILIPELSPQLNESIVDKCCHKIAEIRSKNGRKFALIVIAEGVRNHERQRIKYIGDYLGSWIKSHSKELCSSGNQSFCDFDELDTRVTVLGHLQRTGTPSSFDRILATAFGIKAVNLIEEEKYYQLVVWRNGKVESESLDEVLPILRIVRQEKGCAYPVEPDSVMVETAKSLGIYVGND